MNKEVLKGNWQQVKGKIKKTWGKFTDDEIDQMEGDYDILVGKVQEKYGYEKQKARDRVNDFVKSIEENN